jgi:hypothetical protein
MLDSTLAYPVHFGGNEFIKFMKSGDNPGIRKIGKILAKIRIF